MHFMLNPVALPQSLTLPPRVFWKRRGSIPIKSGMCTQGRNGIIGALTEDLIDTNADSAAAIAALRHTPSGAFGSCRYKLKSLEQNRREYERLIEVFKAHNIGYFFYNGGGDSADTCLKVSQLSGTLGYPIQAIHVPKTVDNDLPITDCCPGFGSVAKYIAVSTREASFDVASMAKTSTKVFVLEVMGRHAGWIAAAGGLASSPDCEIPIVILFPEVTFDKEKFLAKVDRYVRNMATVRSWCRKASKARMATSCRIKDCAMRSVMRNWVVLPR
jgi:6-phosphofructokinase